MAVTTYVKKDGTVKKYVTYVKKRAPSPNPKMTKEERLERKNLRVMLKNLTIDECREVAEYVKTYLPM